MSTGRLPVAGGELAYDVAGDGPPLVLLHAGICDRRRWGRLIRGVAPMPPLERQDIFAELVVGFLEGPALQE